VELEFDDRESITSEMRHGNGIGHGDTVFHEMPAGGQSDVNNSIRKSGALSALEKNIGCINYAPGQGENRRT
jgi:hypothetical protein